jgi:hypothetical protein
MAFVSSIPEKFFSINTWEKVNDEIIKNIKVKILTFILNSFKK